MSVRTMPSEQGADEVILWQKNSGFIENAPRLTPEQQQMAELEIRETPERREKCLEVLRDLLSKEHDSDLRSRTDTAFLLRFLRPAKFDATRARKMIGRYYKLRVETAAMFRNAFTPVDQRMSWPHQLCTVLPHKDAEGRTLFLIRCGSAWDPAKLSKNDFFMSTLLMMELSIRDVQTLIKGSVVIIDMTGLSMCHIKNLTPYDLKNITTMIQDCFPCRIKAIHIVNQPSIFSIIWNIIRHLLSFKMSRRMHLHGSNLAGLHGHVAPKYLPDFLGGPYPLDNSSRVQELLDLNDTFLKDAAYGYIDFTKDYVPRG